MAEPGSRPRPDVPGPLHRRGPRPLLLHLTLAMLRSTASLVASPNWSAVWPNWNAAAAGAEAERIVAALAAGGGDAPGAFPQAVLAEAPRPDPAPVTRHARHR